MTALNDQRIVIAGAGIAGVAAAYFLSVRHGCTNVTLLESDTPLALTSDKSTEAYRNWWPGPDGAMTALMNRSISLMEAFARETDNRINLNRRGYLFATADSGRMRWLTDMALLAETRGAGPVRMHDGATSDYLPVQTGIDGEGLDGADVITNPELLRQHYGYLNPNTVGVAHIRRAGSLSAQQLGMTMLEQARAAGGRLVRGELVGAEQGGGGIRSVTVNSADGTQQLDADVLLLCAGPMLKDLAARLGVDLPIVAERHQKISLADRNGVIPRDAPMLIWLDKQRLPWSEEERELLAQDESTRWLLESFPAGVHCRPEGSGASQQILGLYNYRNQPDDIVFPLPDSPHYAEIVLRGLSTMIPGLADCLDRGERPYVDGGYYIRTQENRPLIGPLPVGGLYVSGAYSGFGIMSACGGADLVARHICGDTLPDYADAFAPNRYDMPGYREMIAGWDEDGQL